MRIEKREAVPKSFEQIKKSLLEHFPKEKVVGLDLERVEDFVREQGFEVKPYIVCQREEISKLIELVQPIKLFNKEVVERLETVGGVYDPVLDVAIVLRDERLESLNSPTYSEGNLVHELIHANSLRYLYTVNHTAISAPRVGFFLTKETAWGYLLEEGFVDMHRARYVSRNLPPEPRKTLTKALHLENLERVLSQLAMEYPVEVSIDEKNNVFVPLPVKYVFFTSEKTLGNPPSAFAGYAVELLCKSNPEIENLFIQARDSLDGLRKLAQALEAIKPGFYRQLQKSEYNDVHFMEKLSLVIDALAQNAPATEKIQ